MVYVKTVVVNDKKKKEDTVKESPKTEKKETKKG